MAALLDVNVLIALLDAGHVHHAVATKWLSEHLDAGWASCPLTQNGCIRILSQASYPNRAPAAEVATRLAEIAAEYGVLLQVSRGDETVDCSSILDVLALALVQGTEISLHAGGEKAAESLRAAQAAVTGQDD